MLTAHQAATTAADLLKQAAALHAQADADTTRAAAVEASGQADQARLIWRAAVINRRRAFELSDLAREAQA